VGKIIERPDDCECDKYPAMELVDPVKDLWELQEDWCVDLPGDRRLRIYVARGYVTDGASIPRLVWPLIGHPLSGKLLQAALAHDALYSIRVLRRSTADRALRDLALANGYHPVKAALVYYSVRAAGRKAWRTRDPAGMGRKVAVCAIQPVAKRA
jgi:hypothetical protein